jgi:hypothetical protein
VDSCGTCKPCRASEEQFCQKHIAFTYNSTELDGKTPTQGGYSTHIVVREKFALRIKKGVPWLVSRRSCAPGSPRIRPSSGTRSAREAAWAWSGLAVSATWR